MAYQKFNSLENEYMALLDIFAHPSLEETQEDNAYRVTLNSVATNNGDLKVEFESYLIGDIYTTKYMDKDSQPRRFKMAIKLDKEITKTKSIEDTKLVLGHYIEFSEEALLDYKYQALLYIANGLKNNLAYSSEGIALKDNMDASLDNLTLYSRARLYNDDLDITLPNTTLTEVYDSEKQEAIEVGKKINELIALSDGDLKVYEDFATKIGKANASARGLGKDIPMGLYRNTDKLLNKQGIRRSVIFCEARALSYLSLISTSTGMVINVMDCAKHMGQNDPAVAASDFFNTLSSGFAVAAAGKEVVKGAVKKEVIGAIGGAVGDQAAKTMVSTSAERLFIGLAGRAVLSAIPIVNTLSFLAFVCQVASWVAMSFKDNKYEAWAKGSSLSKD